MDDIPANSLTKLGTAQDINDQLELCKELLARVNLNTVRGVMLTIADAPDPATLTKEQLDELEVQGLKPEDATRLAHVLIGPIEALVYMFKATGLCINETYQKVKKQFELEQAAEEKQEATAAGVPPGTVLH